MENTASSQSDVATAALKQIEEVESEKARKQRLREEKQRLREKNKEHKSKSAKIVMGILIGTMVVAYLLSLLS